MLRRLDLCEVTSQNATVDLGRIASLPTTGVIDALAVSFLVSVWGEGGRMALMIGMCTVRILGRKINC